MKRENEASLREASVGYLFLPSSLSARRKNPRFRASCRSCEIGRAGNTNFATAGNAGKKKKTGKKRARNCAMAGLDYTVTLASSMENALSRWKTSSPTLSLLHDSSLSLDPRRRAKPHKGNITDRASTASSPHLPGFLTPASLFFTRPPPCFSPPAILLSAQRANLLDRYVQIDSGRVRGPCSRVPRYLILPR